MDKPIELKDLGARLARVDMLLMSLLGRRMDLALEVGKNKASETDKKKQRIFNGGRESQRLKAVRTWAKKHRMNPHFAESFLYPIIGESCKQQMILFQNKREKSKKKNKKNEDQQSTDIQIKKIWNKSLDRNLITLAKRWSETYDEKYDKAFFATQAYLQYEMEILEREIEQLPDKQNFLDIGCATGRLTFQLAPKFEQAVGYDISPHMIAKANERATREKTYRTCFKVADVQNGIQEPNNSVSLAVMNLGTASDVRELPKVLKEISRVLKPHGRFLLSFYNYEALLYRWDFIPWPTGLEAEINTAKECLDVHSGNKVLSIYAKPYTVNEVSEIVKGGITALNISTYPTVSAILPNDLFENQPKVQKSVIEVDKKLADSTLNGGAYIIVTGQKVG